MCVLLVSLLSVSSVCVYVWDVCLLMLGVLLMGDYEGSGRDTQINKMCLKLIQSYRLCNE